MTSLFDIFDNPRSLFDLFDSPHEQRIQGGAQQISAAVPQLQRQHELNFYKGAAKIRDPRTRAQVMSEAEAPLQQLETARGSIFDILGEAARVGDRETVSSMQQAQKQIQRPDPTIADEALRYAGKGLHGLGWLLDRPQALVRQFTTPGEKPFEREITAEEWNEKNRQAAAKDPTSASGIFTGMTDALGWIPGTVLGGAIGGAGALVDAATGEAGLTDRPFFDEKEPFMQTVRSTRQDVSDFIRTLVTDPLSWISFGGSSAAKNAAQSAARTALRHGVEKSVAMGLANEVTAIMGRSGGTRAAVAEVFDAMRRAGVSDDAVAEAFGRSGEFLGRGQLRVNLPFMEDKGIDVLPALGRGEYSGGKAVQAGFEKLGGSKNLFSQERAYAKNYQRQARALRAAFEKEGLTELEQVARAAEGIPKERLQELVTKHIDPAFATGPTGAIPGPDYIPWEQLSAQERKFVETSDTWLQLMRERLVNEGILTPEDIALNPISGKYFPRQYKSVFGGLDELAEVDARGGGQAWSFAKSRVDRPELELERVGVPLGEEMPHAKGVTDPFEALGDVYLKRTARARSQAWLEKQIIKEFGLTKDKAPQYAFASQNRAFKKVRDPELGQDVVLPAEIANVMTGTFDTAYETMGRALRSIPGADSNPMMRAAATGLDWYAKAINVFKRNTLLWRPGYHMVNVMNDSVQMAAHGINNVPGWLTKADTLIRQARKGNKDAIELLARAQKQNIATDALARLDEFGDLGAGVSKRLHRIAQGKTEGILSRTKEALGPGVASGWENRSKLAMFLYGITKGDSDVIASRKAFEVLLDYQDRSRPLQVMRWIFPFFTWMAKAPKMAAQLTARRPGRVISAFRLPEALGGAPAVPREYASERGNLVPLSERGHQVFGGMRQMLGGTPAKEGLQTVMHPRLPFDEAFNSWIHLAQGNVDPLALSLDPASKALYENVEKRDILTKRDIEPTSPGALFPAGTPLVPQALEARSNQIPWLSRYLLPGFVLGPWSTWGLNRGFRQLGDAMAPGEGPVTTIGGERPYAFGRDPRDIEAMRLFNMLMGTPAFEVSPVDALKNLAASPEVKRVPTAGREVKTSREEKDRRRKRGG